MAKAKTKKPVDKDTKLPGYWIALANRYEKALKDIVAVDNARPWQIKDEALRVIAEKALALELNA